MDDVIFEGQGTGNMELLSTASFRKRESSLHLSEQVRNQKGRPAHVPGRTGSSVDHEKSMANIGTQEVTENIIDQLLIQRTMRILSELSRNKAGGVSRLRFNWRLNTTTWTLTRFS
jgi:hypothetical protein